MLRPPKGDRLLGAAKIDLLFTELQRVRYLPWVCTEMRLADGIMRPVGFAGGAGSLALENDYQTPSSELCGAWFGDADPEVFKNQDWTADGFGFYVNQFGAMKKSIYAGRRQPNGEVAEFDRGAGV